MKAFSFRLGIIAVGLLLATSAPAVLIASGDGTGNTTAPPVDPGWSHVGSMNGLSGVYLGDGWVLTANHVGTGPLTLNGVSYPVVPNSSVRLEHAPGVLTDLLLFRLISDPGLSTLPIAAAPPPLGAEAILIGFGRDRGVPFTFSGHPGWRWAYTSAKRWGTNAVSQTSIDLNLNGAPVRAFGLSFDDLGGASPEAVVTTGDSGGAAFLEDALAGILVARWFFGGQTTSSVFGNGSFVADLSFYQSQILAVTAERACSDGLDDDADGLVDLADPGCYGPEDPFETNALAACDDGFDNDADGLADWSNDPGCGQAISIKENPACDDDLDNDGDTGIDWDGGAAAGTPDSTCASTPWLDREHPAPAACGLGFELSLLAPLFARLARRRRT